MCIILVWLVRHNFKMVGSERYKYPWNHYNDILLHAPISVSIISFYAHFPLAYLGPYLVSIGLDWLNHWIKLSTYCSTPNLAPTSAELSQCTAVRGSIIIHHPTTLYHSTTTTRDSHLKLWIRIEKPPGKLEA